MTDILLSVAAVVAVATAMGWAVARWHLRGADLSAFDGPVGERFSRGEKPSEEARAVIASLGGVRQVLKDTPMRQHTAALRTYMDKIFAGRAFDARFVPVDAGGVRAEWVLSPGSDPARRTLYIHGGPFMMGSPLSHRTLTTRFSAMTGGAVLAIDYRLMPEHPRRAGIDDCRNAYRWLLANGPDGATPARAMFVAGDSAGGNLTLSLIAWVRDSGLRAPDAAVALSPLRGDLSRLPPVLVQASELEMLLDDARRYVNKARAAGSPVPLQTWNHMVHVWQIFNPELTEARDALAEIDRFLAEASPPVEPAR